MMEKINSELSLKAAILQLEIKQEEEKRMLRENYLKAYHSLQPVNLVKKTVHELAASSELKTELVNTSIGIATGYVSKIVFQGSSHSAMRKLLGTVLMFGISNTVTKHPEAIKAIGRNLIRMAVGLSKNAHEKHTEANHRT